jgi:hypothetical protein
MTPFLIERLRAVTSQMQEDPAWSALAPWAIRIDALLAEATPAPLITGSIRSWTGWPTSA